MNTILTKRLRFRTLWHHYECDECPGAWELRLPWYTEVRTAAWFQPVDIRWTTPLFQQMSERSTDLLKYIGGDLVSGRVAWVDDDAWKSSL